MMLHTITSMHINQFWQFWAETLLRKYAIKWWFVILTLLTKVSALPWQTWTWTPEIVSFQWCSILCLENNTALACYNFDMHQPIIITFIDNKAVLLGTVCKYYFSPSNVVSKTSNPWVVKLSWLAISCSRPLLSAGDLDELSRSGWPSFLMCDQGSPVGSVHARLQVSVYSGYNLCHPGCPKIDSYNLTPWS